MSMQDWLKDNEKEELKKNTPQWRSSRKENGVYVELCAGWNGKNDKGEYITLLFSKDVQFKKGDKIYLNKNNKK